MEYIENFKKNAQYIQRIIALLGHMQTNSSIKATHDNILTKALQLRFKLPEGIDNTTTLQLADVY